MTENQIQKHYDDITSEEWAGWAWSPVDSFSDMYCRSYKKIEPPNDGYEYVDVTTFGDTEQKWARGILKDEAKG